MGVDALEIIHKVIIIERKIMYCGIGWAHEWHFFWIIAAVIIVLAVLAFVTTLRQGGKSAFPLGASLGASCPACGGAIKNSFLRCPHCAVTLKSHCPSCSKIVETAWRYCPFCRADVGKTQ